MAVAVAVTIVVTFAVAVYVDVTVAVASACVPSNLRALVCSHRGSFAVGWVCFGLGLLRACAWFGIVVLPRPCWSCGLSIYIVIYTAVSLPLLRYSMLLPIPLT